MISFDGILRCSRYAFGPNKLHYCGPDANQEIFSYIKAGVKDPGLEVLLKGFKTMYPYLNYIARENKIKNPFDNRVVEAYWLGNELLETIEKKRFWQHLIEDHKIPQRIGKKSFKLVEEKIRQGGLPHHSFHVLDIWKRTGHLEKEHTFESMDQCRVSSAKVVKIDLPFIFVEREPLIYSDGKILLGSLVLEKIAISLESEVDADGLVIGDLVSLHWGVICEKITPLQARNLKKYTIYHLELANHTI